MGEPEYLNKIEREAIYRIREIFADGREGSVTISSNEEKEFVEKYSSLALYPEKPVIHFQMEENESFFHLAKQFEGRDAVRRLITCGGVDDGKSTLIGRIYYETKSKEEQTAICKNPEYLRQDGTVDYALLAGTTEEEAKQGITVQVSYSVFHRKNVSFLMADVPGHEEYTCNMAYAASMADVAIIMIAANKGIVLQTKRHVRICYFMGITNMIFAVNKMDMVSYNRHAYEQIAEEVEQMMQEYPGCSYEIVPVAAKTGENIVSSSACFPWYQKGSLLNVIERTKRSQNKDMEKFSMPVQRICKSSQMPGALVKKRVIQGEIQAGSLECGDEIFVYPTGRRAKVTKIYQLMKEKESAAFLDEVGIELEQELDVARGYILTKEDHLSSTDRIEADVLWTSDSRLKQGKRYLMKIGTRLLTTVVTRICYKTDVNTGEHKYAEYLMKNAMARCELCFPQPIAITCSDDCRGLGTFQLFSREEKMLVAYGNVMQTISEDAWRENGKAVTAEEREMALGQKAGLILFSDEQKAYESMNFVEHYLLRMGFHTIQTVLEDCSNRDMKHMQSLLDAGLIVLVPVNEAILPGVEALIEDKGRIFDCRTSKETDNFSGILKKIKCWASELV